MVTAFAAEFWFVVSSSACLTFFLSLFLCVFLWPMVFERRGDCEIFVSRNTCEMATAAPKFPKSHGAVSMNFARFAWPCTEARARAGVFRDPTGAQKDSLYRCQNIQEHI